ncbi:putative fad binding domain protein [Lasiodiplodia theobromae]|nr:putative fad binding domain protein [Lasiodiplodia theobromae]
MMGRTGFLQFCSILSSSWLLVGPSAAASTGVTPAQFFPWEENVVTNDTLKNSTQYAAAFGPDTKPSNVNECKVFPGDADWPAEDVWQALNTVVDNALIKTIPSAHDCHDEEYGPYDAEKCAFVAQQWNNSYFHADDPTSISWPLWQGRTCLPTGYNGTSTCTLGGYPSYVVNVSTVAQIQIAVNFARYFDIRLVVKNTGHDFAGKSTGAGALSIWTHYLKDMEFYKAYETPTYSGPAIHVGSGVQAFELYQYAEDNDVTVIGGECESVGVTGGYVLGGGHSPLSSIYGMSADHVLALNVITPDGRFLTASETTHADLFWALRGGGGSTYGVVSSVVVKALPKIPVTISRFSFSTGPNVTADTFWAGFRAYFDDFIVNADAGTYSYFYLLPLGDGQFSFEMRPWFAPNKTVDEFEAIAEPWWARLRELGIPFTPNTTHHESFHAAWRAGFSLEMVGLVTSRSGGRLFPKQNFETAEARDATLAAFRNTTEQGAVLLAYNMKNAAPADQARDANAVNTHWRDSYMLANAGGGFIDVDASAEEIRESFEYLTNDVFGVWRKVAPTGGAYLSESDIFEPDWQEAFYGEHYERLYALKQEIDPLDVFYAPTAVGSENWEVRSEDGWYNQNGRLCRKA